MKPTSKRECALILAQPFSVYYGADFVIAADKGYKRAFENKIKPNLLVGDMDSLFSLPIRIEIVRTPAETGVSDGELGVREAARRGIREMDIYGAIGGRPDHFLYNLNLLKIAFDLGIRAVIRGDYTDVYYTESELTLDVSYADDLSILPLGDHVTVLKTAGLKHPLDGEILTKNDTCGLSCFCVDKKACVQVDGGAFVIHTKEFGGVPLEYEDCGFGMKIQMDEEKVLRENVINLKKVYQAIDDILAEAGVRKGPVEPDGTLTYWGYGTNKDFGRFGIAYNSLSGVNKDWFVPNCSKWLLGSSDETPDGSWEWDDMLAGMRKRGKL